MTYEVKPTPLGHAVFKDGTRTSPVFRSQTEALEKALALTNAQLALATCYTCGAKFRAEHNRRQCTDCRTKARKVDLWAQTQGQT